MRLVSIVSVSFLLLLLVLPSANNSGIPLQIQPESIPPVTVNDLIDSDPIVINGNSDFISMNFPGTGTETDPFLIEGLRIFSEGVCIDISRTTYSFIIRNCLLISYSGSQGRGLDLLKVFNALLENITILDRGTGIDIDSSENISIINCLILATFLDDLIIWDSSNITIKNCELMGRPSRIGSSNNIHLNNLICNSIGVTFTDESTISYCDFKGSLSMTDCIGCAVFNNSFIGGGISLSGRYSIHWTNTLENNTINGRELCFLKNQHNLEFNGLVYAQYILYNCSGIRIRNAAFSDVPEGILLSDCMDCLIESSTFENMGRGIRVFDSESCTIKDCTMSQCAASGIWMVSVFHCTVRNVAINNCGLGIRMTSNCYDTSIKNCKINQTQMEGIRIWTATGINVSQNLITNASTGIYSQHGTKNYVNNNNISARTGVWLNRENGTVLEYNEIDSKSTGFLLWSSDDCIIASNNITSKQTDIAIEASISCYILDNTCWGTGIRIEAEVDYWMLFFPDIQHWTHTISGNLLRGGPIGYYFGLHETVLDSSNYAQLILVNCSDLVISNTEGVDVTSFLYLSYCENISIQELQVFQSERACVLRRSVNCTVSNSLVSNSEIGILLYESSYCNITNSTCIDGEIGVSIMQSNDIIIDDLVSMRNSISGIELYEGSSNTIMNCVSTDNVNGIDLLGSSDNTILNNRIYDGVDGVRLIYSWNNEIASNNITSNSRYGVYCDSSTQDNLVYRNVFRNNGESDALDSGNGNHWNTTGLGNYWSDYSGSGPYFVPGDAGSIDYHPHGYDDTVKPEIDHPDDIIYYETTTGHSIVWSPVEVNPWYYIIYLNGSEVDRGNWEGSQVVMNIDGLSPGVYSYTVVVHDLYSNWVSDEVIVTVLRVLPSGSENDDFLPVVLMSIGFGLGIIIVMIPLYRRIK